MKSTIAFPPEPARRISVESGGVPVEIRILQIYFVSFPLFSQLQPFTLGAFDVTNALIMLAGVAFLLRALQKAPLTPQLDSVSITLILLFLLGSLGLLHGSRVGLYDALPFKVLQFAILWVIALAHRRFAARLSKAFLLGAALAAIGGVAQFLSPATWVFIDTYYLANVDALLTSYAYQNRIASVSFFPPNGNYFGSYMAFAIVVLVGYRDLFNKGVVLSLLVLFSLGLVLSVSITSFLSVVLALFVLMFHSLLTTQSRFKSNRSIWIYYLALPAGALLVASYGVIAGYFLGVIDKLSRYFEPGNYGAPFRGLESRFLLWDAYFDQMSSGGQWFLGIGLGNVGLVDNTWLLLLVALGVLGFLTIFIGLSAAAIKAIKVFLGNPFAAAGMVMFLVMNTTALYILYMPVIAGLFLVVYRPKAAMR